MGYFSIKCTSYLSESENTVSQWALRLIVFWLQQELAFKRPFTKVDMGGISYQTLKKENKIRQ
jgi:hypothetical protein